MYIKYILIYIYGSILTTVSCSTGASCNVPLMSKKHPLHPLPVTYIPSLHHQLSGNSPFLAWPAISNTSLRLQLVINLT